MATILIALIFGFILPITLFLILRKKGKLVDQDASIKEERTFPIYYCNNILCYRIDANDKIQH